mmetsp:Transcript_28776/g.67013  ORF Transcript_28776/g.67013 Transcript_28776/m.67013 type:complete len:109 (+) Transcript_28776:1224-1550(+)
MGCWYVQTLVALLNGHKIGNGLLWRLLETFIMPDWTCTEPGKKPPNAENKPNGGSKARKLAYLSFQTMAQPQSLAQYQIDGVGKRVNFLDVQVFVCMDADDDKLNRER